MLSFSEVGLDAGEAILSLRRALVVVLDDDVDEVGLTRNNNFLRLTRDEFLDIRVV